jgi:hypothetical protein
MDPEILGKTMLKPYESLGTAYRDVLAEYGRNSSVIAMPYGGSTLPVPDKV